MNQKPSEKFSENQQEVLKSIRVSRIILPIVIGLVVVIYLLWKQFDPAEFAKINWTSHTWIWIAFAGVLLIIRHLAYATRLRILSDGEFSWRKCIELIFIWEFSSAVSPTSIGGSAVALFVLSQEKLSGAKTTAIVIYSAVLDTLFFIGTLPILYFFLGPNIIRPNMQSINNLDAWAYTFIGAYIFMAIYGGLFFYGLFIDPKQIKKVLLVVNRLKFLKRFSAKAEQLGDDIIIASREIWRKNWTYHVGAFLATAVPWSCRFLLVNCLIIGIVANTSTDFFTQTLLYGRLQTMFVIMAFSPTPGGVGLAEIVFGGFLYDFVPEGISLVIAFLWRFLTYYAYLIAGAIIIPNWLRKILNRRKKNRIQKL